MDTSNFVNVTDFEAFSDKITTAISGLTTQVHLIVDEKIEQESKQRKQDMQAVRDDLERAISSVNDTTKQLKNITTQLDNVIKSLSNLSTDVIQHKGTVEKYKAIVETKQLSDNEAHRRLDERNQEQDVQIETLKHDNDNMQKLIQAQIQAQIRIESKQDSFRDAIYGNSELKDSAPSVFGMLGSLTVTVNKYRDNAVQTNEKLTAIILDHSRDIDVLTETAKRLEEMVQKQLDAWKQRRKWILALLKNPRMVGTMILGIATFTGLETSTFERAYNWLIGGR
jgi:chromosome segregation ATPase